MSDDLTYDDLSCFKRVNSSRIRCKELSIGCSRASSGSGRFGVSMLLIMTSMGLGRTWTVVMEVQLVLPARRRGEEVMRVTKCRE